MTRVVASMARVVGVLGLLSALCATASAGVLASSHVAHHSSKKFPVPNCGWISAATVSRAVGETVTATKPVWTTGFAPVLVCGYREKKAKLQAPGVNLVTISYGELQYLPLGRSWRPVSGIGTCADSVHCRKQGSPAWSVQNQGFPKSSAPYAVSFPSAFGLYVKDGLNFVTVTIKNPKGPLTVGGELGRAEGLIRPVLARFLWTKFL